jgi:fused signal recognition particle receptor
MRAAMTPTEVAKSLMGQVQPLAQPREISAWAETHLVPALTIAALLLLLLVVLILWRRGVAARRRAAPITPPPALPGEKIQPRIELPPTEAERARLQEAQEARREADQLARNRRELAEAAKAAADGEARQRLESQARELKEREEEAKRDEYRAKKAAEHEARERQRREREEQERLREEAERQAREELEQQALRARQLEQQRIEAQAGQTLAQGLGKTRSEGFISKLNSFFGQPKRVDESVLAQLEEILFTADIGVKTASHLVQLARDRAKANDLTSADRLKAVIREEVERIVNLPAPRSLEGGGRPHVVMVVGVNGSGKTTTIGKLAAKTTQRGGRVVIAAGDTFRAAAAEQLDVWAERANAELVKGADSADPGAVVFDAIKRARQENADLVIADTAGRLHTKVPLMEELKKVKRAMEKALPGAPHEVLLVLDATTGQNAIAQAKQFQEVVGVTDIALTKLDGTAKGGVIIGICDELRIPVTWVGVGEKIADLRPFNPSEFVAALFDEATLN